MPKTGRGGLQRPSEIGRGDAAVEVAHHFEQCGLHALHGADEAPGAGAPAAETTMR